MAGLFDDLIPKPATPGAPPSISFDDLIPAKPKGPRYYSADDPPPVELKGRKTPKPEPGMPGAETFTATGTTEMDNKARQKELDALPPFGQIEPGNIDLHSRPKVKTPDGQIATVRSKSWNFDGTEVLLPTVSDDGRLLSDEEAIQQYQKTGKHLGKFDTPESATAYGERLHQDQAVEYGVTAPPKPGMFDDLIPKADPSYTGEAGKAFVRGAAQTIGSAGKGLSRLTSDDKRKVEAVEAGIAGLASMTPEEATQFVRSIPEAMDINPAAALNYQMAARALWKGDKAKADGYLKTARSLTDTRPLKDQQLYQQSEEFNKSFDTPDWKPAPGWEDALTVQIANALGTTAAFLPVGLASGGTGVAAFGGAMSTDQQGQGAEDQLRLFRAGNDATRSNNRAHGKLPSPFVGLSPEDAERLVAREAKLGFLPGASENAPIELLLDQTARRIPGLRNLVNTPFWAQYKRVAGRIILQGLTEGGQEGGQRVASNLISQFMSNPNQTWDEGAAHDALIGTIVGTGMQSVQEVGSAAMPKAAPEAAPPAAPGPQPGPTPRVEPNMFSDLIPKKPAVELPPTPPGYTGPTENTGITPEDVQSMTPAQRAVIEKDLAEQGAPPPPSVQPVETIDIPRETKPEPGKAPLAPRNFERAKTVSFEDLIPAKPAEIAAPQESGPIQPISEPEEISQPEPSKPLPAETLGSEYREFAPSELKVDAKRFQFKEGGNDAGVTDRLKGVKEWDQTKAGITLVWQNKQGENFVADGHQRHGLASRLEAEGQKPRMLGVTLKEADGITPEKARAIAAAKNIAEGTGTAIDAAKILRDTPNVALSLPPNSALVRDAQGLAKLSPDGFGMVVNKKVQPTHAAIVGQLAPDPQTHAELLGLLAKNEPDNVTEAESMVRDALEAPAVQSTMEDMFGSAETTQILFKERAQILSASATAIRKDRAAFSTLVKEEGRIAKAGNTLVTDKNAERATQDAELLATLQATARRKGPIADALATAAKQLHEGQSAKTVIGNFLDVLRSGNQTTGEGGRSAGGVGRQDEAVGKPEPRVEPQESGKGLFKEEDENEFSPATKNYTPLNSFIPSDKTNIGYRAKEYVLRHGRDRGVEVILSFDADGNVAADGYGNEKEVGFSPLMARMMLDKNEALAVHHNHPASRSLSQQDIRHMASPGTRVVWAHGHDGNSHRASIPDALRKSMAPNALQNMVGYFYDLAKANIHSTLQGAINARDITPDLANKYQAHMVNLALHRAGIIDYKSDFRNDFAPQFIAAIDKAAEAVRKHYENSKQFKENPIRNGGRAQPVRHIADMGRLSEADTGLAGERDGPGRDAEGSGRNDRGKESDQLAEEDDPQFTPPLFATEPGAEGLPQTIIPGAERVSVATQTQRLADAKLKPKVAQKGLEIGLFGDDSKQGSLFEDDPEFAAKVPKSEAFKKWFGKSKVVDAKGQPMVMYHGTGADFGAFDPAKIGSTFGDDKIGFFFTNNTDLDMASGYAERAARDTVGANVIPVYLKLEKPYTFWDYAYGQGWTEDTWKGDETVKEILDGRGVVAWFDTNKRWIIESMDKGYDGFLFHDPDYVMSRTGYAENLAAVFSPTQIKSIFNRGNFDPNDPAILAEDEGDFTTPRRRQSGTRGMPASRPGPSAFIEPDDSAMSVLMNQNLPMLGRVGGAIANASLPIRRGVQDKMADWKRLERAMTEQTGVLPQSMQVYRTETLFHGRTGERLEDLRMDTIEPLIQKMADLKVTQADLDKYLYARHAPERNEYIASINPDLPDGGSGMTNAEAAAVMRDMQRRGVLANVKAIAAKIDIMLRDNRERLFNNGIIDQETFDSWSNDYENYVPLRGFEVDPEADARLGQGKRYDSRTKVTLEALGRKSKADSPLAYIIAQAQQSIILAEKARVGRSVLRMARQYPNPDIWEVNQVVSKRVLDPTTGLVSTRIDNTARVRAENVLAVREGGKLYWVTLHHAGLLAGIKGTEASSMNVVVRTGMTINRYLALMRTGLDPQFFIPNFLRDLETAGIHIGAEKGRGMLKSVLRDLPKALAGSFKGERGNLTSAWAQHYREFAQAGGKVGVFGLEDIGTIKNRIARDMALAEGGTAVSALKAAIAVKDFVMDINGAIESGIRLSLFVNMRRAGYSVDDSAFAAKEVTVNFNRKGEWGNWINATYLFFNASVQGTARIAQALARSKIVRRAAFGMFMTGIIMDVVNSMIAGDSDDDGENDYDQIKEHVKERNLIFMWPGSESGQEIHIPLPWVYNVFFYSGTNVGRIMRGKTKPTEAAANIMGAIAQSANPLYSNSWVQMVTPTILDPGLDLRMNEDWKGDPIMPGDNPFGVEIPNSQKAFETVTPWSKAIAETLNSLTGGDETRPGTIDVSPESIDYIANFIGGGVASTVNQVGSTFGALVRGDEINPERIPFVRKVYGKHVSSTGRGEYYEMRDAIQLTAAQIDAAKDAKDRAKMMEIRKEFPADVRALPLLKETDKLLTKLRKQRNAATSEEAKQKINERMDLIRSRFRKKYRQLQEKLQ